MYVSCQNWIVLEMAVVGNLNIFYDKFHLKGTKAFCSGGDQALRSKEGYADYENFGRLNVLDLQVQIRCLLKPVIAMVAGYAVGGGHVLHMVCDLTIAADNAIFGQTGPKIMAWWRKFRCLQSSGLLRDGGIATSLTIHDNNDNPLQHMIVEGLVKSGSKEARSLAEDIAVRWIRTNYAAYKETGT